MTTAELRKALKERSLAFGSDRTLKRLKIGKVKRVFLASNCSDEIKKEINHYAKLSKVEIIRLRIPKDEIGVICKKPFPIAVLCY